MRVLVTSPAVLRSVAGRFGGQQTGHLTKPKQGSLICLIWPASVLNARLKVGYQGDLLRTARQSCVSDVILTGSLEQER